MRWWDYADIRKNIRRDTFDSTPSIAYTQLEPRIFSYEKHVVLKLDRWKRMEHIEAVGIIGEFHSISYSIENEEEIDCKLYVTYRVFLRFGILENRNLVEFIFHNLSFHICFYWVLCAGWSL